MTSDVSSGLGGRGSPKSRWKKGRSNDFDSDKSENFVDVIHCPKAENLADVMCASSLT